MNDFDDFDKAYSQETKELDRLLAELSDCDLSEWDADFVHDMIKRLAKHGNNVNVTGKQQEQLNRMKDRYL